MNIPVLLTLSILALFHSGSDRILTPLPIVGLWESEEKNLQIEMFEDRGRFAGRMIYFKCKSDDAMNASLNVENLDKR